MKEIKDNERMGFPLKEYRWPLALVFVALIAFAAFVIFIQAGKQALEGSVNASVDTTRAVVEKVESIAERFKQGAINQTFIASLPDISGTGSGHLEIAKVESTETFRMEDDLRIWWDFVSLGKSVAEINVPVTYRYYLSLDDPWNLEVSGQTCLVTAPRIRPAIPPAIHTDRMEKSSSNGWARFNAKQQLAILERGLTPTLVQYAGQESHLKLVREQGRETVAAFVKKWLMQEDHWREDRFTTIKVIFSDEILPANTDLAAATTLD